MNIDYMVEFLIDFVQGMLDVKIPELRETQRIIRSKDEEFMETVSILFVMELGTEWSRMPDAKKP